jgi:hypothetical protein
VNWRIETDDRGYACYEAKKLQFHTRMEAFRWLCAARERGEITTRIPIYIREREDRT